MDNKVILYADTGDEQPARDPLCLEAEIERLRGLLTRLKGTGDRLRDAASAALDMTKEWHGGLCSCRKCRVRDELGLSVDAYDTQRAALAGLTPPGGENDSRGEKG